MRWKDLIAQPCGYPRHRVCHLGATNPAIAEWERNRTVRPMYLNRSDMHNETHLLDVSAYCVKIGSFPVC